MSKKINSSKINNSKIINSEFTDSEFKFGAPPARSRGKVLGSRFLGSSDIYTPISLRQNFSHQEFLHQEFPPLTESPHPRAFSHPTWHSPLVNDSVDNNQMYILNSHPSMIHPSMMFVPIKSTYLPAIKKTFQKQVSRRFIYNVSLSTYKPYKNMTLDNMGAYIKIDFKNNTYNYQSLKQHRLISDRYEGIINFILLLGMKNDIRFVNSKMVNYMLKIGFLKDYKEYHYAHEWTYL